MRKIYNNIRKKVNELQKWNSPSAWHCSIFVLPSATTDPKADGAVMKRGACREEASVPVKMKEKMQISYRNVCESRVCDKKYQLSLVRFCSFLRTKKYKCFFRSRRISTRKRFLEVFSPSLFCLETKNFPSQLHKVTFPLTPYFSPAHTLPFPAQEGEK